MSLKDPFYKDELGRDNYIAIIISRYLYRDIYYPWGKTRTGYVINEKDKKVTITKQNKVFSVISYSLEINDHRD